MKILINDHRKLFAIQEEFATLFPNLGLQFFAKRDHEKSGASDKQVLHNSKTIGECRLVHERGEMTIMPQMTVADLEDTFSSVYGITVEVTVKKNGGQLTTEGRKDQPLGELNRVA